MYLTPQLCPPPRTPAPPLSSLLRSFVLSHRLRIGQQPARQLCRPLLALNNTALLLPKIVEPADLDAQAGGGVGGYEEVGAGAVDGEEADLTRNIVSRELNGKGEERCLEGIRDRRG